MNSKNDIALYEDSKGNVELRVDVQAETVWATQEQIRKLFEVDRTVVTKHVRNILNSAEVDEKSNVQKMHIANSDKPVSLYLLDIILAVGYRTNSAKAIAFRQWVTREMKNHMLSGYTLNQHKLETTPDSLENLHQTLAMIGSPEMAGKLKGSVTLRVTKKLI